jgi:hypothetical protein
MTASGRFGSTIVQMPFFRPKVSRLSRSLCSPASDSHPWPSPRLSARVIEVDAWIERDKAIICKECVETVFNEFSTEKNGGASG